ncbi:MAG: hypothetical protein PHS57_06140 [Alphaproteobacteria bacterium]|nr:hypothetical protein [Alphaproteobacteria bacterium]
MSKTDVTLDLERRIFLYSRGQFGCDEVTIGPFGRERVDFITLDFKGNWRCYEIKASKNDYHSKAQITFIGNLNYYVMPGDLYEELKDEIPTHVGVLVPCGQSGLESVKKARRQAIACSETVLYASLIRSLYRTYERVRASDDEPIITSYKRKVAQLENEIHRVRGRESDARWEGRRMKTFMRRHGLIAEYESECDREDGFQ